MRPVKDFELSVLIQACSHASFATSLTEADQLRCAQLGEPRAPALKHVYFLPYTRSWIVRVWLVNRQYTFSSRGLGDAAKAAAIRIADMFILRTWRYRKRGPLSPGDSDLNLGLEQARADIANEPEVAATIDQIIAHLVASGQLPDDPSLLRKVPQPKLKLKHELAEIKTTLARIEALLQDR